MDAIHFERYGTPDELRLTVRSIPEVRPGRLLVRVAAAGVNPADAALRAGRLRWVARLRLPFVPGADVAGVVEEVGEGVAGWRAGDAVMAMLPAIAGGGYAQYAVVDAVDAARPPADLELGVAATVPLAALTALQALRDAGDMRPGKRVLVYGAGGVGTYAVQIARALGAAEVTAVAHSDKHALLNDLGADRVADRQDGRRRDSKHDLVVDASVRLSLRAMRRDLDAGGTAVTLNPGRGNPLWIALSRLTPGARLASHLVRPSGADLSTVSDWITAGRVQPVVDRTWPLAEAAAAHRYIETGRARGKLGLIVDPDLAATPAALAARSGETS